MPRLLFSSLLGLCFGLGLAGCRTAAVDRFNGPVDPVLNAGEPAYWINPPGAQSAADPNAWYRELQVVLTEKPADEKAIGPLLDPRRAAIKEASTELLLEVQRAIEKKHAGNDKWSLLSMSCGRAKKSSDIQFTAELGLTPLYARRPVIAFDNEPLNLCITKLCRECGVLDSQPRLANPHIYWRKLNVCALDALDALIDENGLQRRYMDVFQRVNLRVQDYATRAQFVTAAAGEIAAKGRLLNAARPALIVTAKDTSSQPPPPPAPGPVERPD